MKIGIMTCWQPDDNYGTQLQCFALQYYLRSINFDPFLIRYYPDNDRYKELKKIKVLKIIKNPIKIIYFFKNRMNFFVSNQVKKKHSRKILEFREKYIKMFQKEYFSYTMLKNDPPDADIYLAGSDQIWNVNEKDFDLQNAVFLNFGNKKIKRISYAASFSKQEISQNWINEIKPLIQKMDFISVREKSAIDICKKCGRNDAVQVIDPTLLNYADNYRNLYKTECTRMAKGKYCFVYEINAKSAFSYNKLNRWCKQKGLSIIYVTGHNSSKIGKQWYATIPEWLMLIDNASYVVTNSFHGAMFSLLFHKQFGVIPLTGLAEFTNIRLDTINDLFGVNQIIKNNDFSVLENKINWNEFETKLNTLRENSKLKYLLEDYVN